MLSDTICAISTALKQGAISIVRMSGEDSFSLIKEISDIKNVEANRIVYGHIYDDGKVIDEVLVSFFKAPKTYTREDMVEINCHGGVYVTRMILNLLLKKGCRLAEPGEFTRRAYLNGRISLAKAEAANDLIMASNRIQARSAIRGLDGSVERLLLPLIEELKDVLSLIEVNIDYPEYDDIEEMTEEKIRPALKKWISECEEAVDKAERFRVIKDGLDTVIIGKPNVGKSSLLNALIEKDKAIVTEIAGTTRDLVEGRVNLKNISLNLIDTAGIHESDDKVEKIGIEKSLAVLDQAQLVILVLDSSNIDEEDERLLELTKNKNRLIVYNKSDLKSYANQLCICAKDREISQLTDKLNEMYQDDVELLEEDVLNNERQIALMKEALNCFMEMEKELDNLSIDVIMIEIEEAYHHLCAILGKEYQEELIDHMFANFCLGK